MQPGAMQSKTVETKHEELAKNHKQGEGEQQNQIDPGRTQTKKLKNSAQRPKSSTFEHLKSQARVRSEIEAQKKIEKLNSKFKALYSSSIMKLKLNNTI